MTQQEFITKLNQLNPTEIVTLPEVRQKYITLYDSIWKEGGDAAYARESRYFNGILTNIISQSKSNNPLDRFSIYNAFTESAITNISLEPGIRALAYLTMRGYNVGGQWVNQVKFTVSGYGEMVARIRCGQIRHADNPVVVYDNDEMVVRDIDGKKSIEYTCHLPHTGKKIVACYMRITRADGSIDYATMYEEDWMRLKAFSEDNNKNSCANALYGKDGGQIDSGFLQAKLIKHAFKTYPKVRIGGLTINSYDEDEQNAIENNMFQSAASFNEPQESVQEPTYEPQISNVGGGVQVDDNDDLF